MADSTKSDTIDTFYEYAVYERGLRDPRIVAGCCLAPTAQAARDQAVVAAAAAFTPVISQLEVLVRPFLS